MERPQVKIEQAQDEFDKEMSPAQANIVALSDVLLELKDNSSVTFVDIVLQDDPKEMIDELHGCGPIADILAGSDEQLAIPSDGSYYPVLDIQKQKAKLMGAALRIFGWESEKIRFIDDIQTSQPPFNYVAYPGQDDKLREINLAISYKQDDTVFTESIILSGGTNAAPQLSSQIWVNDYAETGYEGHGGKTAEASEEAVEWLLDFVAKHVGDEPKSVGMVINERIEAVRRDAEAFGVLESIDRLVDQTWPAQANYLIHAPLKKFGGRSIASMLRSKEENAADIAEMVDVILQKWQSK